jgi:hypothetical protein
MTEQFLTERNLISHDVITDPSQFIAESFRCKACICLGNFSIIVCSESFVVSATQVGRFGKCPAQIPIPVFTVALPFTFAIGQSLGRCTPAIGCEISDLRKTFDITDYVVCLLIQLKYMEIFTKALEADI